jgi:uncharacterized protein YjbJ (UPF0337 family)
MTTELLAQNWPAISRDCRPYWGKLTDEDLDRIGGRYEAFVRTLRQRYGFSQTKAEDELNDFLFRYDRQPAEAAMA